MPLIIEMVVKMSSFVVQALVQVIKIYFLYVVLQFMPEGCHISNIVEQTIQPLHVLS